MKGALQRAFRLHYADLAEALFGLFDAKDAQQRQTACVLTEVEYENLTTALHLSLAAQVRFFDLYAVLGHYLDSVQDHRRGIDLGNSILAQMEQYPPAIRFGAAGDSFLRVQVNLGNGQLTLQRYADAAASYSAAAQLIDQITNADAQTKASWKATVYHQLGRVAQAQRAWGQAEVHYQQALALCIDFNDRYRQAGTYHQLGNVAYEQQQWSQAREYYLQALTIGIEFKDEYRIRTRLQSLARLHRASGDATVVTALPFSRASPCRAF